MTAHVELIRQPYSLWRLGRVYLGVVRENAPRSIVRLIVVAIVMYAGLWFTSLVGAGSFWGSISIATGRLLLTWSAQLLYLSGFQRDLEITLAEEPSAAAARRIGGAAVLSAAGAVLNVSLMFLITFVADAESSGLVGIASILTNYVLFVWFSIALAKMVRGANVIRAWWDGVVFFLDHLGRFIAVLLVALVFHFLLSFVLTLIIAASLGRLGDAQFAAPALSSVSAFIPVLFLPLVVVIHTKLSDFREMKARQLKSLQ